MGEAVMDQVRNSSYYLMRPLLSLDDTITERERIYRLKITVCSR